MRNVRSSILPPGRNLLMRIEPPMRMDEQPIVITMLGRKSVEVTKIDSGVVCVINEGDQVAPFVFFVAPAGWNPFLPRWVSDIIRRLLLKRLRGGE